MTQDRPGKPLFDNLTYCMRCGMPETAEGIQFDELGVCGGCRSQEMKMHINWAEREKQFRELAEHYKAQAGDNYDCLVPISGGKDSVWQLHMVKNVYGMNPLAVTFMRRWESETGIYNLENALEKLDVDHVRFTPRRSLVAKVAKRSLSCIGDACWHCHRGIDIFPLQMARAYDIPLIIFGESSAEGWSGKATHADPPKYDLDYFNKTVTKARLDEMADGETLTMRDLRPFHLPPREDLEKMGLVRLFFSDYFFWDGERNAEFVRRNFGWRETEVEGTYKRYKSAECTMTGVHDYAKFVKRGFGRSADFGCQDARAGLMTREEAFEISKQIDPVRPKSLDYYLEITGLTEDEFFETLMAMRKGAARDLPDPRDMEEYKTAERGTPENRPFGTHPGSAETYLNALKDLSEEPGE